MVIRVKRIRKGHVLGDCLYLIGLGDNGWLLLRLEHLILVGCKIL